MSGVIHIDHRGPVAVLTFNRPEALNAITQEMAKGVADSLIALDSDPDVKGIVLTLPVRATGRSAQAWI